MLAKFVMLNLLPVNYATFNLNHNTATVSLSECSSSTWGQLYMLKISWFKGRSELWNRSARNKCIRPDRVVNLLRDASLLYFDRKNVGYL